MHLEQNGFLSQRTGLLLRLWEGPLLSKCVIMVFSAAACLTEWPRDLLHAGHVTAVESTTSSSQPCGRLYPPDTDATGLSSGMCRLPRVSQERLKMDPSVKRGSPTHLRATSWIVTNVNTSRTLSQFQKMFGQCETVEQRRVYSI